jgi:hypothetical protein
LDNFLFPLTLVLHPLPHHAHSSYTLPTHLFSVIRIRYNFPFYCPHPIQILRGRLCYEIAVLPRYQPPVADLEYLISTSPHVSSLSRLVLVTYTLSPRLFVDFLTKYMQALPRKSNHESIPPHPELLQQLSEETQFTHTVVCQHQQKPQRVRGVGGRLRAQIVCSVATPCHKVHTIGY